MKELTATYKSVIDRCTRVSVDFEELRLRLAGRKANRARALRRLLHAVMWPALWLDRAVYRALARIYGRRPPASSFRDDEIHFFVGSLGLGGTQRQLVSLVRSLSRQGFRSKVWAISVAPNFFADELDAAGASTRSVFDGSGSARFLYALLRLFRYRSYVASTLALARCLRRERPSVLQCLLDTANVSGALAGRMARVPVVVAGLRSVHPEERGEIAMPFHRFCYRLLPPPLVDAVIANSRAGRETFLARTTGFDAGKVRVVHNGLDAQRVLVADAAQHDVPIILWAGRIAPEKRLDCLLRACERLVRLDRAFELRIVGDGPDGPLIELLATELGLANRVRFLPPRAEITDLLAAARVVVLSSDVEGFPNILLEAQLAGCPVVATRAGGVVELVEDGVTGFLVDVGDHAAMADRICRLIDDPKLAHTMGRAGAVRAREQFSAARMAAETLAIYQELALAKGISLPSGPRAPNPPADIW